MSYYSPSIILPTIRPITQEALNNIRFEVIGEAVMGQLKIEGSLGVEIEDLDSFIRHLYCHKTVGYNVYVYTENVRCGVRFVFNERMLIILKGVKDSAGDFEAMYKGSRDEFMKDIITIRRHVELHGREKIVLAEFNKKCQLFYESERAQINTAAELKMWIKEENKKEKYEESK
jgi:hypothetical protein